MKKAWELTHGTQAGCTLHNCSVRILYTREAENRHTRLVAFPPSLSPLCCNAVRSSSMLEAPQFHVPAVRHPTGLPLPSQNRWWCVLSTVSWRQAHTGGRCRTLWARPRVGKQQQQRPSSIVRGPVRAGPRSFTSSPLPSDDRLILRSRQTGRLRTADMLRRTLVRHAKEARRPLISFPDRKAAASQQQRACLVQWRVGERTARQSSPMSFLFSARVIS